MEAFRVLVELLKNVLWASDLAAAGSAQELGDLLGNIKHHAAARLLWDKPFNKDLDARELNSARAFLQRIYGQPGAEKKWDEKVACIKRLDPESLAVLVVLFNGDKAFRTALDTIQALCQGAEKIAKWSPWPRDARLKALVQEFHQPAQSPHTTPPKEEPPVLRCSSCGTPLDLEQTFKQATSGASPNLQIVDRSNQPSINALTSPPATTSPAAPTDITPTAADPSYVDGSQQTSENQSTSGRKRRREEEPGSALEATGTAITPTLASQSHGIESRDACLGLIIPPQAPPSEIIIPPKPHSAQPNPNSGLQISPGLEHTVPAYTSPLAAQSDDVWHKVEYRLGDFFAYLQDYFPKIVEFTCDQFSDGRVRYISPVFAGIWFQVTPSWLEARGLLPLARIKVFRSLLFDGIVDHLRPMYPFGVQENWEITTRWAWGDIDGDGIVCPNVFGELVVKWLRPGSLRDLRVWLFRHHS
ncbi:hypothetical protein VTK26DRAFT_4595 [Humicola hyalothermophila]